MADFLVRRDDLRTTRVDDDAGEAPLSDGEARLRVERFGFTANNVTYGAFGEQMGYWRFFSPPGGWGGGPGWGVGGGGGSPGPEGETGGGVFGSFPRCPPGGGGPPAGGGGGGR